MEKPDYILISKYSNALRKYLPLNYTNTFAAVQIHDLPCFAHCKAKLLGFQILWNLLNNKLPYIDRNAINTNYYGSATAVLRCVKKNCDYQVHCKKVRITELLEHPFEFWYVETFVDHTCASTTLEESKKLKNLMELYSDKKIDCETNMSPKDIINAFLSKNEDSIPDTQKSRNVYNIIKDAFEIFKQNKSALNLFSHSLLEYLAYTMNPSFFNMSPEAKKSVANSLAKLFSHHPKYVDIANDEDKISKIFLTKTIRHFRKANRLIGDVFTILLKILQERPGCYFVIQYDCFDSDGTVSCENQKTSKSLLSHQRESTKGGCGRPPDSTNNKRINSKIKENSQKRKREKISNNSSPIPASKRHCSTDATIRNLPNTESLQIQSNFNNVTSNPSEITYPEAFKAFYSTKSQVIPKLKQNDDEIFDSDNYGGSDLEFDIDNVSDEEFVYKCSSYSPKHVFDRIPKEQASHSTENENRPHDDDGFITNEYHVVVTEEHSDSIGSQPPDTMTVEHNDSTGNQTIASSRRETAQFFIEQCVNNPSKNGIAFHYTPGQATAPPGLTEPGSKKYNGSQDNFDVNCEFFRNKSALVTPNGTEYISKEVKYEPLFQKGEAPFRNRGRLQFRMFFEISNPSTPQAVAKDLSPPSVVEASLSDISTLVSEVPLPVSSSSLSPISSDVEVESIFLDDEGLSPISTSSGLEVSSTSPYTEMTAKLKKRSDSFYYPNLKPDCVKDEVFSMNISDSEDGITVECQRRNKNKNKNRKNSPAFCDMHQKLKDARILTDMQNTPEELMNEIEERLKDFERAEKSSSINHKIYMRYKMGKGNANSLCTLKYVDSDFTLMDYDPISYDSNILIKPELVAIPADDDGWVDFPPDFDYPPYVYDPSSVNDISNINNNPHDFIHPLDDVIIKGRNGTGKSFMRVPSAKADKPFLLKTRNNIRSITRLKMKGKLHSKIWSNSTYCQIYQCEKLGHSIKAENDRFLKQKKKRKEGEELTPPRPPATCGVISHDISEMLFNIMKVFPIDPLKLGQTFSKIFDKFDQQIFAAMSKFQLPYCPTEVFYVPDISRDFVKLVTPVIALNATTLKKVAYGDYTLYLATATTSNNVCIVLAMGIYLKENIVGYQAFLTNFYHVYKDYFHESNPSIISDDNKGLPSSAVLSILPDTIHYNCYKHMSERIRKLNFGNKRKVRNRFISLFHRLQSTTDPYYAQFYYNELMQIISNYDINDDLINYIKDATRFVFAFSETSRTNQLTSYSAKEASLAILGTKYKGPWEIIMRINEMVAAQVETEISKKYFVGRLAGCFVNDTVYLLPGIISNLSHMIMHKDEYFSYRSEDEEDVYTVLPSEKSVLKFFILNSSPTFRPSQFPGLYHAYNKPFGQPPTVTKERRIDDAHSKTQYTVDLGKHTCTCTYFQQLQYPCVHALSVIMHLKRPVSKYCHERFHYETALPIYRKYVGKYRNKTKFPAQEILQVKDLVSKVPVSHKYGLSCLIKNEERKIFMKHNMVQKKIMKLNFELNRMTKKINLQRASLDKYDNTNSDDTIVEQLNKLISDTQAINKGNGDNDYHSEQSQEEENEDNNDNDYDYYYDDDEENQNDE